LKQEAVITVQNVPLTDYLENTFVSTMTKNAQTGRQAIEFVIHQMSEISDDVNKISDKLANMTQKNIDSLLSNSSNSYNYKN